MDKKQVSKSRFKAYLKNFWKDTWEIKSPMYWVHALNTAKWNKTRIMYKLNQAIEKLILEKKCTEDEGANIIKMLESPDEENKILAISIMASLKPKQFRNVE